MKTYFSRFTACVHHFVHCSSRSLWQDTSAAFETSRETNRIVRAEWIC